MTSIIRNAYPLENKRSNDLLQISNLGLRAFWKVHYGDALTVSPIETFNFFPNQEEKVPQYKRDLYVQKNHQYFVSFEVNCQDYTSGKLGLGFGGSQNCLSVSEKTNGFISIQRVFVFKHTQTIPIYFGGIKNARLVGEIRNALMIDLTTYNKM